MSNEWINANGQWQWADLSGVEEERKAGMLLSIVGVNAYRLLTDILTQEKPKDTPKRTVSADCSP